MQPNRNLSHTAFFQQLHRKVLADVVGCTQRQIHKINFVSEAFLLQLLFSLISSSYWCFMPRVDLRIFVLQLRLLYGYFSHPF